MKKAISRSYGDRGLCHVLVLLAFVMTATVAAVGEMEQVLAALKTLQASVSSMDKRQEKLQASVSAIEKRLNHVEEQAVHPSEGAAAASPPKGVLLVSQGPKRPPSARQWPKALHSWEWNHGSHFCEDLSDQTSSARCPDHVMLGERAMAAAQSRTLVRNDAVPPAGCTAYPTSALFDPHSGAFRFADCSKTIANGGDLHEDIVCPAASASAVYTLVCPIGSDGRNCPTDLNGPVNSKDGCAVCPVGYVITKHDMDGDRAFCDSRDSITELQTKCIPQYIKNLEGINGPFEKRSPLSCTTTGPVGVTQFSTHITHDMYYEFKVNVECFLMKRTMCATVDTTQSAYDAGNYTPDELVTARRCASVKELTFSQMTLETVKVINKTTDSATTYTAANTNAVLPVVLTTTTPMDVTNTTSIQASLMQWPAAGSYAQYGSDDQVPSTSLTAAEGGGTTIETDQAACQQKAADAGVRFYAWRSGQSKCRISDDEELKAGTGWSTYTTVIPGDLIGIYMNEMWGQSVNFDTHYGICSQHAQSN